MTGRVRTLRGRVSAVALLVIAGWVIIIAVGFDLVVTARIDAQVDDSLRVRAQAASALVTVKGGAVEGVRESITDRQLDAAIWVYSATRLVEHPAVSAALQRTVDQASDRLGFTDGQDHRFYVLPLRSGGHAVGRIVAGINTEPYEAARRTVLVGSAVVAALVLAGAYPVVRLAAGRALRPVTGLAARAAEWSITDPTQRFGRGVRYAELRDLTARLDELLDRLAAVLRHERQLSAELSHELRTPLTRLLGEVELLREQTPAEQQAALVGMRDSCLRMDRIIDQALATARAGLVPAAARTAVAELLARYRADGPPVVEVSAADVYAGVEATAIARILDAVLENAHRYARGRIELVAGAAAGRIEIRIRDDGPGVPEADAERIFEPGFTTSGGGGHEGAGLGLALARRLARAVEGDLYVEGTAGGTTFVLSLPAG